MSNINNLNEFHGEKEPIEMKEFEDCLSMMYFYDWCTDCMDDVGLFGKWDFEDEIANAWKEYSSFFLSQFEHPKPLYYGNVCALTTLFEGNEFFLKDGKKINEALLDNIIPKENIGEDRQNKSKLLFKRVKKVVDGLEKNGELSEDYLLKTIYGVCRFFFEYRKSYFLTETEMWVVYELAMIVVHNKLELAERYGGASGIFMYMLIFDVIMSINECFPSYYGEFSILLGWGLWIPAGCSNLYTDSVSYEKFRYGLQNLDFWEGAYGHMVNKKDRLINEDDPDYLEKLYQNYNRNYSVAFPQNGIDESDDEVLKIFGDGEVPREH